MQCKNPGDIISGALMYVTGFEPTTYWSVASRSIQLSYTYIYRFSPATVCIVTVAGENVNRIF